jgi:hypothetical protein
MTRLEHRYDETNPAMLEGALIHRLMWRFTELAFKGGEADFGQAEDTIRECFAEKHGLSEETLSNVRTRFLHYCENGFYHESDGRYGIHTDIILDLEVTQDVTLVGGQRFKVVIDRANLWRRDDGKSVLEIIDMKNHRRFLTQEQLEQHAQLRIYRHAAASYLYKGADFIRSGIYYTQYNTIRWSEMKPIAECQHEFAATEEYLARQWDRIVKTKIEDMHPERCGRCFKYGGCPVMLAGDCPAWSKAEVAMIKRRGSIEDQVRLLKKMDLERKDLYKTVTDYFSEAASTEVDGETVGYEEQKSAKYPLSEFVRWAEAHNIPLSSLTINKTDVEKLMKAARKTGSFSPEDEVEVEGMKVETVSTRFTY